MTILSIAGVQGVKRCNCKTGSCKTGRCKCKEAKRPFNSRCHGGNGNPNCENKYITMNKVYYNN